VEKYYTARQTTDYNYYGVETCKNTNSHNI